MGAWRSREKKTDLITVKDIPSDFHPYLNQVLTILDSSFAFASIFKT